jgi:hypothetical protein
MFYRLLILLISISAEREGLLTMIPEGGKPKEYRCRRCAPLHFYSPRFEKQAFHARKTKMPLAEHLYSFAEREGFEPSIQV